MYYITPNLIIEYHQSMLADEVRTQSFLRAILKSVRPGDVVLDIGCGTGVLSLFACMAGARRAYAVEQGPVIELAKAICRQNGFQDRITFLNDWSTNIELPEPVDVIVTETIGNIGFEEGILGWILDTKQRLLAEGGRIIPRSVELVVVPVESPNDYACLNSWSPNFYTLDFSPGRLVAANNLLWTDLSTQSFLSDPASVVCLETARVTGVDFGDETSFIVKRTGQLHGLGGWFVAELTPGQTVSNQPPNQTPSWSHVFLPLVRPLPVTAGDRLRVRIQAHSNAAQWQWQVCVQHGANGNVTVWDAIQADQTTLSGQLLAPAHLRALDYTPVRTAAGEVDLFILQLMDGSRSLEQIARRTATKFHTYFSSFDHAVEHVGSVIEYYGRWAINEVVREEPPIPGSSWQELDAL